MVELYGSEFKKCIPVYVDTEKNKDINKDNIIVFEFISENTLIDM